MSFRKKGLSADRILQIGIAALTILWLPLLNIGFDPHHDGLILTTVELMKSALIHGGSWPFNQYGPAWTFYYAIPTLIVPKSFTMIAIRILTEISYGITAWLIWRISSRFGQKTFGLSVVFLFLASQPFVSNLGSDLVPWPSSVVMPLIAAALLLLLMATETESQGKQCVLFACSGVFISIILFSRVQVGIILLFAISAFLLYSKSLKSAFLVAVGFFSFSAIFCLYLAINHWLTPALYDEFVFGFTYLKGDTTSTYPTPIFTALGVLLFAAFLLVRMDKLILKLNLSRRTFITLTFLSSSILALTSLAILRTRKLDSLGILVTFERRTWISFTLAALFVFILKFILDSTKGLKARSATRNFRTVSFLVIFALASESQVYPLFDQMHFWWGSIPAVVIVTLSIQKFINSNFKNLKNQATLTLLGVVILCFGATIPWFSQISSKVSPLPSNTAYGISVSESQAKSDAELQNFFRLKIKPGSKVLNLCDNSEVFFQANLAVPASRIFVSWVNSFQSKEYETDWIGSPKDLVVTCSMTQVASLEKMATANQNKILTAAAPRRVLIGSLTPTPGKTWSIWEVKR